MRVAGKAFFLLALGLAACGQGGPEGAANNAAITEIEALPPDESVETPTDELVNGAAEPINDNATQPPERSD